MSADAAQVGLAWWKWLIAGLFPISSIVGQLIGFLRGSRALDQVIRAKDAQIEQLSSSLADEKRYSAREVRAEVLAFKESYLDAKAKYNEAKHSLERAREEIASLAAKVTDLQQKAAEMKAANRDEVRSPGPLDEVLDLASAVGLSGATVVDSVTSVMDSTTAGESIIAAAWGKLSPEEWDRRAARLRAGGSWDEPGQSADPRK